VSNLGPTWRVTILNSTGQTIAANSLFVYTKRIKFDSANGLVFESGEATILSSGSTLANAAYLTGTTQDNTGASALWFYAILRFKVTAPASSNGNVALYLEHSTDGGTNWDDNGLGRLIALLNFTTSGTKQRTLVI
jgi:hypothetical protein